MKTIIVVTMLMFAGLAEAKYTPDELCQQYHRIAERIMSCRQLNAPIGELMSPLKDNKLLRGIVIRAYKSPVYTTDSYRDRAIAEFANSVATECYSTLAKRDL